MGIQKAVASSVRTPGFYQTANFLASDISGAAGVERILITGPKFSAGDITPDAEVRRIFGPEDAATSHGRGNPVHRAALEFFDVTSDVEVYVGAPAVATGDAATNTYTFSGTATAKTVVEIVVVGFATQVPWEVGETATQFVTRAVSYVNGNNPLPVVLSSGAGAGELDIDAPIPGTWGNDCSVRFKVISGGAGCTIPASAPLAGGTTEPDYEDLLAFIAEWNFVHLPCISNADVILGATSNLRLLRTHIDTYNSGLGAKHQAVVVGFTGSAPNAITSAVAVNSVSFELFAGRDAEGLPCELAARELGEQMRVLAIRPNYNRIGDSLEGIRGAADHQQSRYSEAEVEALLRAGVTPMGYRFDGTPYVIRPVTTHSQTTTGNPDDRCYNASDFWGGRAVAVDCQNAMPEAFKNSSIVPNLPKGAANDLPAGVVEVKDVEAWLFDRVGQWIGRGVVDATRFADARAKGKFATQIDADDPSQFNYVIPTPIVKPLAKISGVHNIS